VRDIAKETPLGSGPVFLGGYPKSGTTLLCALLDSHPKLVVFPDETKYLSTFRFNEELGFRDELARYIDRFHLFGKESLYSSGYRDYTHIDFSVFRDAALEYFDASDGAVARGLEAVMLGYKKAIGRAALPAKKWVEKTPRNERYFELARSWWPEAKLIVMIRDPREALLSHRRYQIKRSSNKRIALGDFVLAWLDSYERASAEIREDSSRAMIVRFESLVATRVGTMEDVASFMNIPVDPTLFIPTKAGKDWEGNSSHGDSKISNVKADTVKLVRLGGLEIIYINYILGFAIKEFGYPLSSWFPSLPKKLSKANGKIGRVIQRIGNSFSKE